MLNIYMVVGLVLGCWACDETREVDAPDAFGVTVKNATVKAGEAVDFDFAGNPDYIVFFSGEKGQKYENRNRTKIVANAVTMNFRSVVRYGKTVPTLRIFVSTDFNGTYDMENIQSEGANWIDITEEFTIPLTSASSWTNTTPSGNFNLQKHIDTNKNFYIAYQFLQNGSEGSAYRTWQIPEFNIDIDSDSDGLINVCTIQSAGWVGVIAPGSNPSADYKPKKVTDGLIELKGGTAGTAKTEIWMISKKIDASSVDSDRGQSISNYSYELPAFRYYYELPGTYTATFVGTNANIHESKQAVRSVQITVE